MEKVSQNFTVRNAVGSYVNIVEPKKSMNGDDMEYSIQVVISDDHPDLPALQTSIKTMLEQAHGSKRITSYGLRKRTNDAGETEWFMNARKKERFGAVPVYSRQGVPVEPTHDTVFSGCIFNVQLSAYSFDTSGNRGIGFGINGLQIVDNVNVKRLDAQVDLGAVFKPLDDEDVQVAEDKPVQEAEPATAAKQAKEQITEQEIPW